MMSGRANWATVAVFLLAAIAGVAQSAQLKHQRVAQVEVPGRRIELKALNGTVLFVPEGVRSDKAVPLIVHFHGAPWLVQYHLAKARPNAALITVQLGAGSSVYGKPFANTDMFKAITDEARVADIPRPGGRRGHVPIGVHRLGKEPDGGNARRPEDLDL